MTTTLLTSDAKEALRKAVRGLRARLIDDLTEAAKSEYRLDLARDKARLPAARLGRRKRLDEWIDEQSRGESTKATKKDLHARFLRQAVQEAAHTLLNRLVLVRILEHHALLAPCVVTGGWKSPAYANEFVQYAGPLADDDAKGYRHLLDAVYGELALELPGLFGNVGLTALFPVPAATLRAVVEMLNEPALASAWGDDTTLGWVYQYWNDPERDALDAKISARGKIEPHEIASKTQMFTERYMVEWLLQNSLGFTWLAICKKNGWTPDAEQVLPELERRRLEWRKKREAGEVALDALMPVDPGLMADWKYYVPQAVPDDAPEQAASSIADVKLLDPACGSGHFLVIAFGLFARMYDEEARKKGETWTAADITQRIVARNLHGIDIDARAIQIAAAGLWLKAKLHAPDARLARMNLVAPSFRLAALPKDDPARAALETELSALGIPRETTARLVDALKGVDYLGTLLRVDRTIGEQAEADAGPLFVHGAKRARLEEHLAAFLDAHAAESDLGLRLEGEQLAAGVRFVELAKEGRYDVVVGNPPYQAISKTANFEYVAKNYRLGRADLYAAFLERGLELARDGGLAALLTMRGWMFLGQFAKMRSEIVHEYDVRVLGDVDRGAFADVPDEVLATVMSVIRRAPATGASIAVQPTPLDDRSRDSGRTARKRSALLAQVGRYEFDPRGFAVIEGEPIVYWWTKEFLGRYAGAKKVRDVARVRQGIATGNDVRFVRRHFEIPKGHLTALLARNESDIVLSGWFPFLKGAAGKVWFEDLDDVLGWQANGLQLALSSKSRYGRAAEFYFAPGIAFSMIGAGFAARIHRYRSIIGHMGSSVYPARDDEDVVLCALNARTAVEVAASLNPGIHFEVGDVNRLPILPVQNASEICSVLASAFEERESHREPSYEFKSPGPSPWRAAQEWAQRAVDRPDGAPLPAKCQEVDSADPEAALSFALGVALGRFGARGEGILDTPPLTALPAGILLVGPGEAYPDCLSHPSVAEVLAAWESYTPSTGKKPPLRDWLRKDFFAYHKALYENRPIYFPLSSEKKSFVAWVSIHRWTDATLNTLLADHLNPVLRQLDAEIRDVNVARASSEKKTAIAAEKQYASAKRLRDELAEFIAKVTEGAERGAPPTDPPRDRREVDAPFVMDLEDGVMINSAALWPLLAPQWNDPKKWWKQLCLAEGRKDYDWAHLTRRYFPKRVDDKCKADPSLAVAHGCFWKYHPAEAFAWELRLQDEIRQDFTIDELGSDTARAAYQREHAADAEAAREKERVRRERKAAKREDEEVATEGEGEEDDDD